MKQLYAAFALLVVCCAAPKFAETGRTGESELLGSCCNNPRSSILSPVEYLSIFVIARRTSIEKGKQLGEVLSPWAKGEEVDFDQVMLANESQRRFDKELMDEVFSITPPTEKCREFRDLAFMDVRAYDVLDAMIRHIAQENPASPDRVNLMREEVLEIGLIEANMELEKRLVEVAAECGVDWEVLLEEVEASSIEMLLSNVCCSVSNTPSQPLSGRTAEHQTCGNKSGTD